MLRLLPERLYAGLLGQSAWLAQGGGEPLAAPTTLPVGVTPSEMLDLLLHAVPARRSMRRLSVMLPSQSARCVSLPWNADLRGEEEKHAYALAHLEQAGLGTCDDHALHVEFRDYGAQGFAYAVPRLLLEDLHAVADRYALNLTTALPIGGIAHLAARRGRGTGSEVTLVVEEAAVSAFIVDRVGLQRYDAEPAIGGQRAALRRLLTRLAANTGEFTAISLCADRDDDALADMAGTLVPMVAVQRTKSSQWRRFL